jgi:hypothetical protein
MNQELVFPIIFPLILSFIQFAHSQPPSVLGKAYFYSEVQSILQDVTPIFDDMFRFVKLTPQGFINFYFERKSPKWVEIQPTTFKRPQNLKIKGLERGDLIFASQVFTHFLRTFDWKTKKYIPNEIVIGVFSHTCEHKESFFFPCYCQLTDKTFEETLYQPTHNQQKVSDSVNFNKTFTFPIEYNCKTSKDI